jgi:hypothetical protein
MASATFQLVQAPDFNVNVKKKMDLFPLFSILIVLNKVSLISILEF